MESNTCRIVVLSLANPTTLWIHICAHIPGVSISSLEHKISELNFDYMNLKQIEETMSCYLLGKRSDAQYEGV